jgi:hypothetical protein
MTIPVQQVQQPKQPNAGHEAVKGVLTDAALATPLMMAGGSAGVGLAHAAEKGTFKGVGGEMKGFIADKVNSLKSGLKAPGGLKNLAKNALKSKVAMGFAGAKALEETGSFLVRRHQLSKAMNQNQQVKQASFFDPE